MQLDVDLHFAAALRLLAQNIVELPDVLECKEEVHMRKLKIGVAGAVALLALLPAPQLTAWIFQIDEGERLCEQIANAAKHMRTSNTDELTIVYAPKKGVDQRYSVQLAKVAYHPHVPMDPPYAGLTVLVDKGHGGFCNRHVLFVGVPRSWNLTKRGAPTTILLRREGDEIDVIDVR
jgi:hypothetical protein